MIKRWVHCKPPRWAAVAMALVLAGAWLATALPSQAAPGQAGKGAGHGHARNIILIVGDGTSHSLLQAARLVAAGPSGRLAVDELPHTASVLTHSANSLVTDSAAAATAMATGVKTVNGAVGVDAAGKAVPTVLERAKAAGKAVGLVTTSYITDATPAAFAAHVTNRDDTTAIAAQMLERGVDVILGGGENDFLPADQNGCYPQPGKRTDGRDLMAEARSQGYTTICRADELDELAGRPVKKVLGLFADGDLFPALYQEAGAAAGDDGGKSGGDVPSLATMTARAIEVLARNPKGFFLLVEEEGTDELAHARDVAGAVRAARGLDAAVEVALRFARDRRDTLVIVVGDHETGGLAIQGTGNGYSSDPQAPCPAGAEGPFQTPGGQAFCLSQVTAAHTGQPVPIAAYGPGAARVTGVLDNTDVARIMLAAMGLNRKP
ncbi:MAG TPA: alkaline phosphatase [Thermaerobacter sp.]